MSQGNKLNAESASNRNAKVSSFKLSNINLRQYTMLIALVIVVAIFQFATNGVLLVPRNISNLIFQNAYVVILAVGMLLCILTGGNIDLSVGSTVGVIGALAGTLIINNKMNPYLAIIVCLAAGVVIGMWQGFWIAYVGIPPFIVTLTGMLIFRGMNQRILDGLTLAPFPKNFLKLATGYIPGPTWIIETGAKKPLKLDVITLVLGGLIILLVLGTRIPKIIRLKKDMNQGIERIEKTIQTIFICIVVGLLAYTLASFKGIPTVLIIVAIVCLIYTYFTSQTVAGRYLYALGGNAKAAQLSGINTKKAFFLVYTNMSFLAALAGLVFAARLNSASPSAGVGHEMDAIASCFIGGASAYGGVGTVAGALVGAAFMGVLNNGMSIVGIDADIQNIVKGIVLLFAVAFDVVTKRKSK